MLRVRLCNVCVWAGQWRIRRSQGPDVWCFRVLNSYFFGQLRPLTADSATDALGKPLYYVEAKAGLFAVVGLGARSDMPKAIRSLVNLAKRISAIIGSISSTSAWTSTVSVFNLLSLSSDNRPRSLVAGIWVLVMLLLCDWSETQLTKWTLAWMLLLLKGILLASPPGMALLISHGNHGGREMNLKSCWHEEKKKFLYLYSDTILLFMWT